MKGSDYLNQVITAQTCSHTTRPEDFYNLTILESLKQIREGAHKDLVLWLRSLKKNATQKKRKKELPIFFYSGMLSHQGDGNTMAYSGVVISESDNASVATRRELIANPHVLAILHSVGGQNYSVLVPIEPLPKSPAEYEAASRQVFDMLGAHLLRQGKNIVKRFQTASYDPDLFVNPDSQPFPVDYSGLKRAYSNPGHIISTPAKEPENHESGMERLTGSLANIHARQSGIDTALQEKDKALIEKLITPKHTAEKTQNHVDLFKPNQGKNVERLQATLLNDSIRGGDGQSSEQPDVSPSNFAPSYLGNTTMGVEKPGLTHNGLDNKEKLISKPKPGLEADNQLDLDSVFYAELDQINQEYKYVVNMHLYQQLVRPLIVSLCTAHESIIHRLSKLIRDRINHGDSGSSIELTLEDIVGDSFFEKAKKYFEHVLRCPIDLTPAINQSLNDLGSIRNVIVDQHAWIDKGKNQELYSRIEQGKIRGVTLKYGELIIRIDYAISAVSLIMDHLEKLIAVVKKRYSFIQGH